MYPSTTGMPGAEAMCASKGTWMRSYRWTAWRRAGLALLGAGAATLAGARPSNAGPPGPEHLDRVDTPHQSDCPLAGYSPGTEVWRLATTAPVEGAAAVATDRGIYLATTNGVVHAVTCGGAARWTFDYAEHNAFGFRAHAFAAGPAVADDGTLFAGDGAATPNFFFALNAIDGSPQWIHEEFGAASQIVVGPALSRAGQVFAATTGAQPVLGGSILAFDARGFLLPSYPIAVPGGVTGSPVVLADDRVVVVANGFTRTVALTAPTATPFGLPTPSRMPSRTLPPTATARATPTPPIGGPPTATRTGPPTVTQTGPPARITATPPSDPRLYVPVALKGAVSPAPSAGATVSSVPPRAEPTVSSVPPSAVPPPGQPTVPPRPLPPVPPPLPTPPAASPLQATSTALPTSTALSTPTANRSPTTVFPSATPPRSPSSLPPPIRPTPVPAVTEQVPPKLLVLGPSGMLASADVGEGAVSSLAASGTAVVFQVQGTPPRLVAFDVSAAPPVKLWDHFMAGLVVDAPILGRADPATGLVDLYYADNGGRLVALAVPLAGGTGQVPRFKWAKTLPAAVLGAPVLGDAGMLYVGVGTSLRAFRTTDGSEAWSHDVGDTVTGALQMGDGGVVYAPLGLGAVVAIATESKGLDPEARWPTVRGDVRNTGRARP